MINKDIEIIINKISIGDIESLKELYNEFNHAIYSLSFYMLKNKQAAEDVTQEVFLKIWHNANTYCKEKGNAKAWIMGIARNESIDYMRKNKHEINSDFNEEFAIDNGISTAHEQVLSKIHIEEALSVLSEINRQIIVLHIMGDLTFRTVSKLMNMPLGTVVWKYQSSIKELQKLLCKID